MVLCDIFGWLSRKKDALPPQKALYNDYHKLSNAMYYKMPIIRLQNAYETPPKRLWHASKMTQKLSVFLSSR